MTLGLHLPLRGSRLIEASAGTGKTYTIALLYLRLVLGSEGREDGEDDDVAGQPLLPPEILVMTFTVAATRELSARIRERLVEAAALFRGDPAAAQDRNADDPLLQLRQGYPPEQWPACARRLALAAEWMDEAAVSTIHAWALRMLQEHAFDSGHLFQQTLLPDPADVLRDAVRDHWRSRFLHLDTATLRRVRQAFADPDALETALRTALKRSEAALHYAGQPLAATELTAVLGDAGAAQQHCEAMEQALRQRYQEEGEAIRNFLLSHRERLHGSRIRSKNDPDAFAADLDGLDAWAAGQIAATETLLPKLCPPPFTGKGEQPEHPFFADAQAWLDVRTELDEQSRRLRALILADAREAVRERMERALHERAELGFDEVLNRLDAALSGAQGERLASRIRAQFPVALIDEFQDTDPVQYRILDAIYRVAADAEDSTIILIGDPKQAIYSFRGADIHTYLAARRAIGERHHSLDTNFRSTPAMVGAVNRLFERAEAFDRGAFGFRRGDDDPVPFEPVQARGRQDTLQLAGEPAPALTAWWLPQPVPLRVADYQQQLAEQAASRLCHWLNDPNSGFIAADGSFTPLLPRHVAILVRKGQEAACMQDALNARGIPNLYLSDRESVFASAEAGDVLRWLRAAAEPTRAQLLREALATPTLGLSLAELDTLQQDELAWERQQQRFLDYHRCWREQGVLPMLRRLLHDHDVPRRLLAGSAGNRRLTNLLHLGEWAQEASITLDGEAALIRLLGEHISDPGGEEEILRLESDAELVQVVTVHKAKGLEYPLVLLPFAAHWTGLRSGQDLIYHDDGGTRLELAPKAEAADAWQAADSERLQEEIRLLYVALTRARHATCIGVGPIAPGNHKTPQLHQGALGCLLGGGQPFADPDSVHEALATLSDPVSSPAADGRPRQAWLIEAVEPEPTLARFRPQQTALPSRPARLPGHAPFRRWWIASYSALRSSDAAGLHTETTDGTSTAAVAPETAQDATRDEDLPAMHDRHREEVLGSPTPGTLHAFPRGPEPGTFLHELIEWACQRGLQHGVDEALQQYVSQRCQQRGWEAHAAVLQQWLAQLLDCPLPLAASPALRLGTLEQYRPEQNFWFAVEAATSGDLDAAVCAAVLPGQPRPALGSARLEGLLTGFIDLVCEHDGRFYVIDWKSNYLGPDDAAYTPEALDAALLGHRYDVQLVLYLIALHRHLRRVLPDYDYDRHVGGGLFVFLRGLGADSRGVLQQRPDRDLIETIDALLLGEAAP